MIIKKIQSGKMEALTYLIGCEESKEAVVIDPCKRIEELMAMAEKEGLKINYIFNTHYHFDHTNGNRKLKNLTGAKILIHKADHSSLRCPIHIVKLFTNCWSYSPKPDIVITEDCDFMVGKLGFKIVHTPGHSPGGICFYTGGVLFTGDTLFVGRTGMTELPGGSAKAMGESIRKLLKTFPGDTVVYPGHDYGDTPTTTLAYEQEFNERAHELGFYKGGRYE